MVKYLWKPASHTLLSIRRHQDLRSIKPSNLRPTKEVEAIWHTTLCCNRIHDEQVVRKYLLRPYTECFYKMGHSIAVRNTFPVTILQITICHQTAFKCDCIFQTLGILRTRRLATLETRLVEKTSNSRQQSSTSALILFQHCIPTTFFSLSCKWGLSSCPNRALITPRTLHWLPVRTMHLLFARIYYEKVYILFQFGARQGHTPLINLGTAASPVLPTPGPRVK